MGSASIFRIQPFSFAFTDSSLAWISTTYSLHYLYSFCVIPHRITFRLSQHSIQNDLFFNKNIRENLLTPLPYAHTLSVSLSLRHTHVHTPLLFSQSKEPVSLQRLIGSSEKWSSLTCLTSPHTPLLPSASATVHGVTDTTE